MKKAKILSLVLACSLLFHTAGMEVLATAASEPVPAEQSVEAPEDVPSEETVDTETPEQSKEEEGTEEEGTEEEGTEEDSGEAQEPEQPSEPEEGSGEETETPGQPSDEEGETKEPADETEEPSDETEKPADETEVPGADEDVSGEDEVSDSEETISDNTISENDLPEENSEKDSEEDAFAIFPGLGDTYKMSSAQIKDKQVLAAHVGDIVDTNVRKADEYPDAEGLYELGQVVYLAETAKEAEQVAAAFAGEVDSYSYGVAVIRLPEEATVALAVAAAADPDIKLPAVWPNYYNHLTEDINETKAVSGTTDPGLGNQWQHDYIGTGYAWAAGYKGQGVKVAVIDTGLQRSHEDLSNNAVTGRNFVDGAAGADYDADNGDHGTHVAGIIAADDNGKGGVGIAPDAQVRGYCVFPAGGGADSADVMRAITAAVEDGNDIINMSLGSAMYDANYEKTVNDAYQEGVAVFAASGNEDTSAFSFPASYKGAISVGAVDQNSARAAFSNYGSAVKLSFPGVHIYSTLPSGYGYMSGTSQASPAAAGTAAVILSADESIRNKTGKGRVDALLAKMKSSTTKCSSSGMGAGTTWLPGALKIASDITAPDAPVITIDETPSKGTTYTAESVTATLSTKTAVGVEIWYSTNGKNPTYKNGEVLNASKCSNGTRVTLAGAKKVTIKAIALNPVTGKISKVATKSCSLAPIPRIVTLTSKTGISNVAAGKSLALTAAVTPDYAVSNKVQWSVDAAAKAAGITVTNGTVKTKNTTPAGTYTVTATAVGSDGRTYNGTTGTYALVVITKASVKKIAFMDGTAKLKAQTLDRSETLNLKQYLVVTKEDGTEAAAGDVVWSSSNSKVADVNSNGVVTAVAPGKAVIKAVSNDGYNKSASCNVTVNQPVTRITLTGSAKVAVGRSITLKATITPANATNKKVTWKVEGNDKVTVSGSGKVTAKAGATGTCTVTATSADKGHESSEPYTVTILSGEITKITLSHSNMVLFSKNTTAATPLTGKLSATIEGKPGADSTLITWASSAPSIANVDQNGNVTAKAPGKATITCAAADGSNKKATCKVSVNVPMSKLSIGTTDSYGDYFDSQNGYVGFIAPGKSIKMSAKYSANYGVPTDKKVTWSSSDPNILTVDKNGKVTANKDAAVNSKAVITATAADGSGVVSNQYTFRIAPLLKKINVDDLVVIGTDGTNLYLPPYFTAAVSGGKNPGLDKVYDEEDGCYYLYPIPGTVTTQKAPNTPASGMTSKDMIKMTVTVKLRDGSGLTAKTTIYAARFKNGAVRYFEIRYI